jgi:16S rRNA (guanine(966)-N(2))-methyltransferase RsmD
MRIITGTAKGRRLRSPRGRDVRPTADRVKESIFNILGNQWENTNVLDLFAGTGNLGLEAISRGARHVCFVEKSRASLKILRENVSSCGFASRATILGMEVRRALNLLGRRRESFRVIFADPPYGRGWVEKILREILIQGVLSPEGVIVMEHASHEPLARDLEALTLLERKTYGETVVSFLGLKVQEKKEGSGNPDRAGEVDYGERPK